MTRFVVQLEYLVEPTTDEWASVVRYDHDGEGSAQAAHDVTEEGLHIDVYLDGEKADTHELTPPLPANEALRVAEDHLAEHVQGYVERFERWHGIRHDDP